MDINDLMPGGFDAANQPDPPAPEKKPPMPPGCPGNCMITPQPDFYANKKGTGYYFKVEMIVLAGTYAGRKLWDYINVSNPHPLTEQLAKAQLKKLCLAAGIANFTSKAEFTGKIVRPAIKVDGIYNVVTDYAVADMAELAAGQQTAVAVADTPVRIPVREQPPYAAPPDSPPTAAQMYDAATAAQQVEAREAGLAAFVTAIDPHGVGPQEAGTPVPFEGAADPVPNQDSQYHTIPNTPQEGPYTAPATLNPFPQQVPPS